MKAPYTQEDFEKLLKQRNLTEADFKRDMRRQLTKTKLLNRRSSRRSTSPTPRSPPITPRIKRIQFD